MEKLSRTQKLENIRNDINSGSQPQNIDNFGNVNVPLEQGFIPGNQQQNFIQQMPNDNQQIVNPYGPPPILQPQQDINNQFNQPFPQQPQQPQQAVNQQPYGQNPQQGLPGFGFNQPGQNLPLGNDPLSPFGNLNQFNDMGMQTNMNPMAGPQPTVPDLSSLDSMFNNNVSANDNNFFADLLQEAKQYSVDQGFRANDDTSANIINDMTNRGVMPVPGNPPMQQNFQEIPVMPNLNDLIPNQQSQNEVASAFEQTVRNEAQQVYSNQGQPMSIQEQIDTIDQANQGVFEEKLPPRQVVGAEEGTYRFETGKMAVIDNHITTSVEGAEAQGDLDVVIQQRIQDETIELQRRIGEYEEELDDVNGTVTYTNKVLNIILIFLILGLTVVLAVVIYWILNVRGII